LPDIEVELLAEGKGIFDVKVDGTLIFSKYEINRFPEPGEVSGLIRESTA
jgi:selT/selW/selH-like putative selenoprotein